MANADQDRRRDVRVTFRATAKLKFGEDRIFDECETGNISISGVFVGGVVGVERGEKCDVEFYLSGRTSSLVLEMDGEVVRVEENGIALQFLDVDQDSFCHLQNIVFFNYRQEGGLDSIEEVSDVVDDESLYLSLEERKGKPLPANYLDDKDSDDDFFDDDLDRDILDQVDSWRDDDDDY